MACVSSESRARTPASAASSAPSRVYAVTVWNASRRPVRRLRRYRSSALGVLTGGGHEAPQRVAHQLADTREVERAHLGIEALRVLGGERHDAEVEAVAGEGHQGEGLEVRGRFSEPRLALVDRVVAAIRSLHLLDELAHLRRHRRELLGVG